MSEEADDDWFESAVSDGDDEGASQETAAEMDEEADGSEAEPAGGDATEEATDALDADSPDAANEPTPESDTASESPFGGGTPGPSGDGEAGSPSEEEPVSPFEEESASAFGGGGSTFGGGTGDVAGGPAEGGPEGEGLFDDDFASAFEGAGDESDFADEDFESEIPRLDLGIAGLDEMVQGGVPKRHLLTCIGSPGTGKTTFGLQFLHHGLEQGQKGVFITLEQSHEAIIDTADERGWDFAAHEADDELAVVDLDPVEMANSLDNIRAELPHLIEDFGADRLVLDSVSLLEMMYDDQARRRTEVFDFTRSLKKAGVTTFLTSEASDSNPFASRHGIIEYLTDAVFILRYVRSETRETRLAVEIQKIRNANHSRETKPYEITMDGISVYRQANIF